LKFRRSVVRNGAGQSPVCQGKSPIAGVPDAVLDLLSH
jgi:hypothetical protein